MKVSELIERLRTMPQDLEVVAVEEIWHYPVGLPRVVRLNRAARLANEGEEVVSLSGGEYEEPWPIPGRIDVDKV